MKYMFLILFTLLAGCGGRPNNFTSESQTIDGQMTCSHISGEHEMNIAKIQDISKERKTENSNNVGLFLVAPFLLDLSSTEKDEISALLKRNVRLEKLSNEKKCNIFKPVVDDL